MYNRYIPPETQYIPAEEPSSPAPEVQEPPGESSAQEAAGRPASHAGLQEKLSALLPGLGGGGLSRLPKSLGLDRLDLGDILLALIVLCLLTEGDDTELAIALGIVLLLGLGEEKKKEDT